MRFSLMLSLFAHTLIATIFFPSISPLDIFSSMMPAAVCFHTMI